MQRIIEIQKAPTTVADPTERNHLRLLDDIALLSVIKKGDEAAETLRQTPTSIECYYAKNAPCTGASRRDWPQDSTTRREVMTAQSAIPGQHSTVYNRL